MTSIPPLSQADYFNSNVYNDNTKHKIFILVKVKYQLIIIITKPGVSNG
jgi:hypothetical protein